PQSTPFPYTTLFRSYVNYRPVKLLSESLSPLRDKKKIDMVIFRENTEGAYVGMGGNFKKGTPDEVAVQEDVSTRKGVERIIRYRSEEHTSELQSLRH